MVRIVEVMPQAEAIRELEFHVGARRNEPAGFSLRTVFWILVTGACYYLATRIAWALRFPDSKVSLFFLRTRFSFPFCCLSRPGTGGPIRWPRLAAISSPRSRPIGRRSTHCTARFSMP